MGRRTRTRVTLALWALAGTSSSRTPVFSGAEHGSSSWLGGGAVLGARAQTVDSSTGRWAQASALLSPSDDPTLLVISGKTAVAGQTVDSAPSTSSALSLNLSQPILDLDNPPWSTLDATGPIASYASLVPLSSSAALFFGGDASSDPAVAVQTGNDSSWLLDLAPPSSTTTTSDTLVPSWSHETAALWPSQPQRRELAFTASATNGTLSRAWLYGGQRPDGSGTTFAELWELEVTVGRDGALDSPRWAAWEADDAGADVPPPMYDGTAVLVPGAKSTDLPSVYLVGGAQVDQGTASLVDLSRMWAFTPDSTLGGGSWALVETSGAKVPPARRGHVAVAVGGGKVWVQGGRSLDGSTVLDDAWILDTRRKRWTEARKGAQVWGHSAAMVGETVVLTFGYGVNAPASTALTVYAPGNNTWLDAYYPSYAVVVSNPKAGGSSSSPSTAVSPGEPSTDAGANDQPTGTAIDPPVDPAATGSPSSSTGDGDSSSSNDDSPPAPAWTAPGSAGTSPSDADSSSSSPDGTSSDGGSSSDGGAPSKSTIAGAVVGSLLGALAVVAGAAFAVRRHRDAQSGARRYAGAGFTGDDDEFGRPRGGGGAGAGSLMAEHRLNGGYASSEAYNLDKVHLAPAAAPAGGGVLGALAGLLSPRDKFASSTAAAAGRKRRFDILKDEENDEARDGRKEGWARFDDDGEGEGEDEAGSALGGGRGGMGIWEGFGGVSGGIDRLSDSLKSSSSYLGGALGGFVGATATSRSGSRRRRSGGGLVGDDDEDRFADSEPVQRTPHDHAYAAVGLVGAPAGADPALAPIAEWEEDDGDDDEARYGRDESRTLDTHSSGTHATGSTVPSSGAESSPTKAAAVRIVRPFSPASSLYGSAFEGHQPLYGVDPALTRTASDRSLASATNRLVHRSNSSWWSRLNLPKPSAADVSTPTAAVAIRDPAPAPSVVGLATASNPFLDPPPPPASAESADAPTSSSSHFAAPTRQPSYPVTRPDEMGRFGAGGTGHLVRGEHDSSMSSNATDVTATSSVLEERLRHMDVVERIRTGSAGDSSVEVTPTLGGDGSSFGQLPSSSSALDNPFADAPTRPQLAYTPAQDSVIWAGSLAGALSEVGGSARPSTPPPRVPSVPGILPPTPTYAPPDSPRKRLVGPRAQPMSPGGSRPAPFGTPTRSSSVKDLVASIEQRRAPPPAPPVLAPAPSSGAVARKRAKVEHGLVKKPLLYVANPDV
ncbi:uncharacterized protein RHOBADRAFT_54536 [Rhodotorula graminis WP1]|uniref:Galactose oxidase n=1 Tax=Rhodotorula graminis (strain WP1) TaxID=578459 RepID=A0A0P9GKP5_RHOGW|nr:uncharacterized protein RHOBADRAFT_54536 [Rhodotorula graminis WP1]KPV73952.1 hypothetical protein RHOBADRAFT_54536 [Rhodotorula graminis WP1]